MKSPRSSPAKTGCGRRFSGSDLAALEKAAARRQEEPLGWRKVKPGANPWYEVTEVEPREDWLRTAFFRLGHPVEKVKRVAFGSLRDPALGLGRFPELKDAEVERLLYEAAPAARLRQRRAG